MRYVPDGNHLHDTQTSCSKRVDPPSDGHQERIVAKKTGENVYLWITKRMYGLRQVSCAWCHTLTNLQSEIEVESEVPAEELTGNPRNYQQSAVYPTEVSFEHTACSSLSPIHYVNPSGAF